MMVVCVAVAGDGSMAAWLGRFGSRREEVGGWVSGLVVRSGVGDSVWVVVQ